MDISLPIRIIRDVVHRTRLTTLANIAAERKEDRSPVTQIDSLVETIVAEHLRSEFGTELLILGEESSEFNPPSVGEIRRARLLMTIDGIDGTTEFVRHVNGGDKNPLWLVAMTAVYRCDEATNRLVPLLSFAYQPHADCLYVYVAGQALLIDDPLRAARTSTFDISLLPSDRPRGSLDVYLPKPECPHAIAPGFCTQQGPSGYNMVSLLESCAVGRQPRHTEPVNFTSFHYNLWDFSLWPILNAVGFATADYEHLHQSYSELRPDLWGEDNAPPGKVLRPLMLASPTIMPKLQGLLTCR